MLVVKNVPDMVKLHHAKQRKVQCFWAFILDRILHTTTP